MKVELKKAEMYSREYWKKLAKAQALSSNALRYGFNQTGQVLNQDTVVSIKISVKWGPVTLYTENIWFPFKAVIDCH